MTKSRGIRQRHGKRRTKEYAVWCGVKGRCTNEQNAAYHNYGGRGIGICDRWMSFENFLADMGCCPPGMTLERVDNNKGYEPGNCRWDTRTAQSRNRRNLHVVTIDGRSAPLSVWVEEIGMASYRTVHQRIIKGWDAKRAITTPKVTKRKCISRGNDIARSVEPMVNGIPLSEAIAASGLKHDTVLQRIRRGWSVEQALSDEAKKGPHRRGAENGVVFNDPQERAA